MEEVKNEEEKLEQFSATSTHELVKALYKDDFGRPFEMTPGQNEIFDAIFKKQHRRVHIMTFTQYGKSDVVSMATLTRVATFGDKFAIIAPSQPKARIIMGYLIRHVFDNEFTLSRFKIKEGESMDVIRRERSKNRLTFDCGNNRIGEIFILSAESRLKNTQDVGNSLMGFGSPNVIEDEAALISDESDAKAMRMVGGFTSKGEDFVVKIGNPFTRGHFLQAYEDPAYQKINISYEKGIKEGRLRPDFIEEMRKKPYFKVLYDNRFPEADDIDSKGWTQLLSEDEIELAMNYDEKPQHTGEKRMGHDIARSGSDYSTWVKRSMNFMEVLNKLHITDLTENAAQTMLYMKDEDIRPEDTFLDVIGVGGGEVDHLKYQKKSIKAINASNTALHYNEFVNVRAEAYWEMRRWIKGGGKLCRCHEDDWMMMAKIKYKPDSKGRVRIMSKDEMRAHGMESPDVCDAGMLTFARPEHGDTEDMKRRRAARKKLRAKNRNGVAVSMGGY